MFTSVQLTMASHLAKPKATWEDMDTQGLVPTQGMDIIDTCS